MEVELLLQVAQEQLTFGILMTELRQRVKTFPMSLQIPEYIW